ncbi:MAG: hypothetical protein V9E92_09950 [Methylotenera sp.]
MKPIYLNHSLQAEQTHWSSWLMLAIGVLVFGSTLVMLQQIKASNAALQAQHVAHSASKQLTMPRINRPERDVDAEAVNNAIRDIVTPWASLLKALETAAIEENVKMLTFEPNAKTRNLRLKLVALDKAAMWAYMHNLNQQNILKEIRLISNEAVDLNGQPALEFLVEAKWPI